jgi:hypothetical protein
MREGRGENPNHSMIILPFFLRKNHQVYSAASCGAQLKNPGGFKRMAAPFEDLTVFSWFRSVTFTMKKFFRTSSATSPMKMRHSPVNPR